VIHIVVQRYACSINIISLFLRVRRDATGKLYHNLWCYYRDVIASAFPVYIRINPPRNHRRNKFDITIPDGSPIGPKTFRFHFGETIFRLNSHRNPYIYGRHVDITRYGTPDLWLNSVEYGWLGQNRSFCHNEHGLDRKCILILFEVIIELSSKTVNPKRFESFVSKRNAIKSYCASMRGNIFFQFYFILHMGVS